LKILDPSEIMEQNAHHVSLSWL